MSAGVWVTICQEEWPEPGAEAWRTCYTFFVLLTTYLLPLGATALAYVAVSRRLWQRRPPGNADTARDLYQLQSKRRVRTVRIRLRMQSAYNDIVRYRYADLAEYLWINNWRGSRLFSVVLCRKSASYFLHCRRRRTNKQTDRQTDRNHFNRNTTSVVIHLNLHENIRFMSEMIQDRAVDTMADWLPLISTSVSETIRKAPLAEAQTALGKQEIRSV